MFPKILERMGISKRAFTGLVVAGFMAILIGAVLLVISYVVVQAVVTGVTSGGTLGGLTQANTSWNISFWNTISVITQALGIAGIALVIVGIAIIVSVLMGLAGGTQGRR